MNKLKIKIFSMILLYIIILYFSMQVKAQNQLPKVVKGKIERIENFKSKYISSRTVDVWLPEGYSETEKYSVLYMHDGQMLFDSDNSWNKQAWNIDDVASVLFNSGKIQKFIVVGIWNGGQTRHSDYFPQKPFEQMTNSEKETVTIQLKKIGRIKDSFKPVSNNYLRFIVKELKPYIDKNYSVFSNKENTFIAGSSMGGLISIYAICEYPRIFGGAACLSTHWTGIFTLENNPVPNAMMKYLKKKLPNPKEHKIYFDCGDQTLDALYPSIQKMVDSLMSIKGYDKINWLTKYFSGDDHSEKSWNKRLHIPLEFLFSKPDEENKK